MIKLDLLATSFADASPHEMMREQVICIAMAATARCSACAACTARYSGEKTRTFPSPGQRRRGREVPTLNWIGKEAVEHHHKEVPYRLIHCDGALSAGDPDARNLLVQGDNLEALKALLPYYGGQVKCIYIDPPYNTGKSDWTYNDRVDSAEIAAWLGKAVGKEAEDLSRHDKWLCMMYPRIRLLRDFLREDGVIFVSCDDNEQAALHLLLAEIFGRSNRHCCRKAS
jgi:hypothetical protein